MHVNKDRKHAGEIDVHEICTDERRVSETEEELPALPAFHLVIKSGKALNVFLWEHVVHCGDALSKLDIQPAVNGTCVEPSLRNTVVHLEKLLWMTVQHIPILI